jgi:hypothetical protein
MSRSVIVAAQLHRRASIDDLQAEYHPLKATKPEPALSLLWAFFEPAFLFLLRLDARVCAPRPKAGVMLKRMML